MICTVLMLIAQMNGIQYDAATLVKICLLYTSTVKIKGNSGVVLKMAEG